MTQRNAQSGKKQRSNGDAVAVRHGEFVRSAYHLGSTVVPMNIRPARLEDRESIRQILISTNRFTDEEVGWAMELVDDAVSRNRQSEYDVRVIEETARDSEPLGYVCFGPVPMAEGVFDLYWIAVTPARQGEGLGRRLLQFVEDETRGRAGRMLLIETRSRTAWAPTLRFYERSGYEEISRIKDFYRIEDDKVVFCKRLIAS